MRQRQRRLNRAAQRIFVHAIRRRARRSPIDHRAHRNRQPVLRHILVNRIVREARQRIVDFIDMHFRFFGVRSTSPAAKRSR